MPKQHRLQEPKVARDSPKRVEPNEILSPHLLVKGLLGARRRVRRGQLLGPGGLVFAREERGRLRRHSRRPQRRRTAPSSHRLLFMGYRVINQLTKLFFCASLETACTVSRIIPPSSRTSCFLELGWAFTENQKQRFVVGQLILAQFGSNEVIS